MGIGIKGAQPLPDEGRAALDDWRKVKLTGPHEDMAEKVEYAFSVLFNTPLPSQYGQTLYVQTATNPDYMNVENAVGTFVENSRALAAAMDNKSLRMFDINKMPVANQGEAKDMAKPALERLSAVVEKAFKKEYDASVKVAEANEARQRDRY